MDIVEFTVQGSSATPYPVSFIYEENKLGAFCTCAAGSSGTACKHRLSILAGSDPGIISGSLDQIPKVLAWLKGSEIETCMTELAAAEEQFEKAKKQVSTKKRNYQRHSRSNGAEPQRLNIRVFYTHIYPPT